MATPARAQHRLRLSIATVAAAALTMPTFGCNDNGASGHTSDTVPTDESEGVVGSASSGIGSTGDVGDDTNSAGLFVAITYAPHPKVATMIVVRWRLTRVTDATWLEFSFEDDQWYASPERDGHVDAHLEVALGVPEGAALSLRLASRTSGKQMRSNIFRTTNGRAPKAMPRATVEIFDDQLASDNRWMIGAVSERGAGGYGGPNWIYIIDRRARVVWYHRPAGGINGELNQSFWPRLSRDGTHISLDRQIRAIDGDLLFTTLDFSYQREVRLPDQGDCYDVTDDGHILYTTRDNPALLREVAPDGTRRDVWECKFEHCYSNTVNWDPASDAVLLSFPYINTVVQIDRASGKVRSLWGDEGDWSFSPEPLGLDFNHWPNITPEGTLMVSSHLPGTDTHLFMEYEINEAIKTLTKKWTYGEGQNDWAEERGMASRAPGGNMLGNYGSSGVIVEVTPDKQLAWRIVYEGRLLGNNTFIDDLYALNRGPETR
ncbi:MAG: hypothetical protein V3V08_10220 [Nannocystaceae bacterium]